MSATESVRTEVRITRRKVHADGWTVWAKYPHQENGKNHRVRLVNEKPYCETCDQYCIGYIAVCALLSGKSSLNAEDET